MKEIISSAQNVRVKNLKKLAKAAGRKGQKRFVIEGLRETVLAHRAGYFIEELYLCKALRQQDAQYPLSELDEVAARWELTPALYQSIAYRGGTEGVIAIATTQEHRLTDLHLPDNALVLVVEAIEKPGNLGAMLRTCDAAGVDAVLICDAKTTVYNPNVIRSSIGTVFTNRLAVCTAEEAIFFLQQHGITTYAAELQTEQTPYQQDFLKATAIVVGSEAEGLTATWLAAADRKIKIPMHGKIDSLNVSVSAAVLLFEAQRQRTAVGEKNNGSRRTG